MQFSSALERKKQEAPGKSKGEGKQILSVTLIFI